MERLELNHFKAFATKVVLEDADKKNILLFGENGAGKSSLFSAIEYIFYKDKIEVVDPMLPPLEQQSKLAEIRDRYKNIQSSVPFSIDINGVNSSAFNVTPFQVFMLNRFDKASRISIRDVLTKNFFPINIDIDTFIAEKYDFIIDNVNIELSAFFYEPIEISLGDATNGYEIVLKNKETQLSRSLELDKFFNEAIINLVQLLIWFSAVQLAEDNTKKCIIVLDDFITSLDTANRAYVMRYILKTFVSEQLVILTHDYSLFNITEFLFKHVFRKSAAWNLYRLYLLGDTHQLDMVSDIKTIELKKLLRSGTNINDLGNKVRKCFEQRLHVLAAELSVGQLEKTSDIIESIGKSKSVYLKKDSSLSDLISDIESMLPTIVDPTIRQTFQEKIDDFKVPGAAKLKDTINLLKFYQKVTMHPASHGALGAPHYTRKDVEESIRLLEELDKCIKSILDGRI